MSPEPDSWVERQHPLVRYVRRVVDHQRGNEHTVRAIAVASFVTAVALVAFTAWSPPTAEAIVCGPTMNVGTSTELDDAIVCFNDAGAGTAPYTINLTANIGYAVFNVATEINQPDAATELTINGAGFTVQGPGGFTFFDDLFTISGPGGVTFNDMTILNSAFHGIHVQAGAGSVQIADTYLAGLGSAGVRVAGGTVTVADSAITDAGTIGVFVAGGAATVSNVRIEGGIEGIGISAGSISVSNSSIADTSDDGIQVNGGAISVSNSTIKASVDDGVEVTDGSVWVANSTILGSNTGVDIGGGSVSVVSSVVIEGCAGSLAGSANNFFTAQSCGPGSTNLVGGIDPFDSNGCAVTTPLGDTSTHTSTSDPIQSKKRT